MGSDGSLYGTAFRGDSGSTVFRIDSAGQFRLVQRLSSLGGVSFLGSDGALYGSMIDSVFQIDAAGTFSFLPNSFDDGAYVYVSVMDDEGVLYGTTATGGGFGTVFQIDATGVFESLHSFGGTDGYPFIGADGAHPASPLVRARDGALYGTTSNGGASGFGTIFKVSDACEFSSVHSFEGPDGVPTAAGLVRGTDGGLYATTREGGDWDRGSIFRSIEPGPSRRSTRSMERMAPIQPTPSWQQMTVGSTARRKPGQEEAVWYFAFPSRGGRCRAVRGSQRWRSSRG
jgi:uncharacterized repeat protein (TIGR03803 family)